MLTPRQMRVVATMLVVLRRILIQKLVADFKDDRREVDRLYGVFLRNVKALPPIMRSEVFLLEYVSLPAKRQIEREGVLAQNGRYNY